MHSWRDGLSPDAQAEVDRLLDSALSLAQQHLAQASEFDPFAIFSDRDGRVMLIGYDRQAVKERPDTELIMHNLLGQLTAVREPARATAIVVNTRLSREKTDAIEVQLEHRDGMALVVLLPYKRARFGPGIEFGELGAFAGRRVIWS